MHHDYLPPSAPERVIVHLGSAELRRVEGPRHHSARVSDAGFAIVFPAICDQELVMMMAGVSSAATRTSFSFFYFDVVVYLFAVLQRRTRDRNARNALTRQFLYSFLRPCLLSRPTVGMVQYGGSTPVWRGRLAPKEFPKETLKSLLRNY